MSELIETTYCPYCECKINQPFNEENRLFGNKITCPSHLCKREFVVNCAHIHDSDEGPVSVREIREIETDQSTLQEFV